MVILNSYHQGYEWSDKELAGLLDRLRQDYPLMDPSIEYLDAKRFPGQAQEERMRRYLAGKYRDRKVDLVIALDNPALDLALHYRQDLFPSVPLVFAGVNDFTPAMLKGQDKVTGVAEVQDTAGTLNLALSLHPGAKEVLVIYDYTTTGLAARREVEILLPAFEGRVKVSFTPPATFQEILEQVKSLPPGSIGLIMGFATDRLGVSLSQSESTRLLTAAGVPFYALNEPRLGHGIVGGVLLGGHEHGRRAGEIALKVLTGEDPARILVDTKSTAKPMFDYLQLQRFHIPLESMPPDSVVINRPESFFAKYRSLVLGSLAIMAALGLTVLILATAIIRQRRAEKRLRESEAKYRKLFVSIPDAVMVLRADSWDFVDVNPAALALYGYTREEFQARCYPDIPNDPEESLTSMLQDPADHLQKNPSRHEKYHRKKDGIIFPVEISVEAFVCQEHRLLCAIVRDITERRQAAEALQKERRILEDILEATLAGYWDWDIPNNTEYLSQTFKKMFGYEADELPDLPETWQKLIFPEDLATVREAFDIHVQSRGEVPYYNEVRYRHKNGETVWVICAGRVIEWDEAGKPRRMVGCHVDITARKQAELALRESEEKYRLLFENAPLGIAHYDRDGTVTDLNEAFANIIGASKESIIGFNLRQQLKNEPMRQAVEASMTGRTGYYEGEYLSVTGDRKTQVRAFCRGVFSETGIFLGGIGIFEDYTDKFLAEQKHQEYLNFLQILMDAIPNPIFYKDVEGRYLGCNKACEEAWGRSSADLMGKTVFDQHPRELAEIYYARDAELFGNPGVQVYETSIAHAGGARRDAILHKATFSHLDGTLGGLIGVEVDITERKRADEQVRASLKEKEVLLKEIHHRVKNNMQIISTLLALQVKYRRTEDPTDLFQDCQNRIRSMALIHESLYGSENLASINFRLYLEKLSTRLLASYGSMAQGIKVTMAGTEVHLDINQAVPCSLIANELMVNSLKHAFPGRKEGEIQVSIEGTDDCRVLEVRDNGVGLGPDFDLENPTTFGWMMVKNLAKQLGGDFTVESNGGTSCRIVF